MPFTYEYRRGALTVDCVVFGLDDEDLKVMLIQRGLPPFEGKATLRSGIRVLAREIELRKRLFPAVKKKC